MKMTKYNIYLKTLYIRSLAIIAGCLWMGAGEANAADNLTIGRNELAVSLPLGIAKDSVGGDYAVEMTPFLYNGAGDTLRLDPVIFRAQRNAKYVDRLRYFGDMDPAFCPEYAAGETMNYTATVSRADVPWIWGADGVSLGVEREKAGCCKVEPMAPLLLGSALWVVPFAPVWAPVPDNTGKAGALEIDNPVLQHISKYRPYDDTRVLRKEEGALYVHFPLDKWDLRRDFRDNADILDRIVDITAQIISDSTSNVKIIQIIGLASVEGPLKRNMLLGQNRADALKTYIQRNVDNVPDSLFEVVNGGEAWTELRDQIEDLDFEGRDQLLEIMATESNPDARERKMKALRGGRPYSYLRDNVLSDQRNSGYLRIYWDYVPDTNAAIINGASELLGQERWAEALEQLLPVAADQRSWNALGVAYYMTGNHDEGLRYFERAAAAGNPQAAANLRQLREE